MLGMWWEHRAPLPAHATATPHARRARCARRPCASAATPSPASLARSSFWRASSRPTSQSTVSLGRSHGGGGEGEPGRDQGAWASVAPRSRVRCGWPWCCGQAAALLRAEPQDSPPVSRICLPCRRRGLWLQHQRGQHPADLEHPGGLGRRPSAPRPEPPVARVRCLACLAPAAPDGAPRPPTHSPCPRLPRPALPAGRSSSTQLRRESGTTRV